MPDPRSALGALEALRLGNAMILRFAVLGAVLGLDVVSFPQAMISRPLVAATLGGALAGEPGRGLLVGAVLELVALETLPVGASRYPEWGSASVVGGALYALHPEGAAGALVLAVTCALATAWIGGESMILLRRLNGQLARAQAAALHAGSGRSVSMLQFAGLGFDLARGFALTVIALYLSLPLLASTVGHWGADPRLSRAVVVSVAATVAGSAVWKLFHMVPRARLLFAIGISAGLLRLAFR
ncbi:hypothetical protein tb265_28150 [Gemmatimonadetes bacterium T265]|nr:hypothetical protein tb265_28150 [Gemmatimonadetes bacterium T265]